MRWVKKNSHRENYSTDKTRHLRRKKKFTFSGNLEELRKSDVILCIAPSKSSQNPRMPVAVITFYKELIL